MTSSNGNNPTYLSVIIIAAIIGGIVGSIGTYLIEQDLTEDRNKVITDQLMLFVHNEIYENYANRLKTNDNDNLLSLKGLELINLSAGNLTIKNKQLSPLIKMYIYFNIFNNKIDKLRENQSQLISEIKSDKKLEEVQKWRELCIQEIENYQEEFCNNGELESEIRIK